MKIICTAKEVAEIIYACGGSNACISCALKCVCDGPNDLFDALHIANEGDLYASKFIKNEKDGGLVI